MRINQNTDIYNKLHNIRERGIISIIEIIIIC